MENVRTMIKTIKELEADKKLTHGGAVQDIRIDTLKDVLGLIDELNIEHSGYKFIDIEELKARIKG